ncbi:hypothetical protein H4219_001707 [Mycoemilia scoparia]|uniref:FAD-binding FR-type domain-containing protein n=1 Tax=Mycoemilia scoparia TaxID=417184 RepID=A0A9W8A5C6_9FUNG|nr:hypothetical protein H4219_001707 [Mycoemilia scoparia]
MFWKASTIGIRVSFAFILAFMTPTVLSMLRLTPLSRWIKFEKNVHAHKLVAYTLVSWVIVHVVISYHFFYTISRPTKGPDGSTQPPEMTFKELLFHTPRGITGHIMGISFVIIAITATPIVRRKAYEVFYYSHHLFIVILISMLVHVKVAIEFFPYLGAFIVIYATDRLYRAVRGYGGGAQVVRAIPHAGGVVELKFKAKMVHPLPGQFVRVCCPSVNPLQWHPFTLTSLPGQKDNIYSIHFKRVGGFTNKFAEKLGVQNAVNIVAKNTDGGNGSATTGSHSLDSNRGSSSSLFPSGRRSGANMPRIFVDGPYGAPTQHIFSYEVGVLVAGGIGITPFASALRHHLALSIAKSAPVRPTRLHLVWSIRSISALEWFSDLWGAYAQQDELLLDSVTLLVYCTNSLEAEQYGEVEMTSDDPWGSHQLTIDEQKQKQNLRFSIPRNMKIYVGRPSYARILSYIGQQYARTKIGVISCGPKPMNRSLRGQLRASSKSAKRVKSSFDFRAEHF